MKTTRFLACAVLLISAVSAAAVLAQDPPAQENDILAAASKAGQFETFLAAVKAAGLTEKLQGEGPFTVFAPTDEAFAALPAGALDDLLEPANRAKLAGLLANHVVPGKIAAADVKTMKAANVSGQDLSLRIDDGVVCVNNARVTRPDLVAGNGVIHGIDAVIVSAPPQDKAASEKPKDHPAH